MARDKLTEYSATASDNTVCGDVNIAENSALPSDLNNYAREIMTHLKNFSDGTDAIDALAVDNLKLDGNTISSTDTNGNITLDPNGTGAVGLCVTPEAFNTVDGAAQVGTRQTLTSFSNDAGIGYNHYYSSGWKYTNADVARRFSSTSTVPFIWQYAASGSADAAITWSEAMRVNSDGKLLIGATSSDTDDVIQIESPASGGGYGIQIRRNDNNTDQQVGSIKFGNTSDSDLGQILVKTAGAANSGALTFSTATSGTTAEKMRISGNEVYIGTTAYAGATVTIKHTGAGDGLGIWNANGTSGYFGQIRFRNNANSGDVGSIVRTNNASVSYNTTSDHRAKENVADMTGAIARVKQLAPKRFNFIADTTDTLVDGFLAHEAQTVVPEAVTGTHNEVDDDGNAVMQGIDQSKLVPLLTGALQEAIAKIETLETKVAALEAAD